MANKCITCGKFISPGGRIASCGNCTAKYHKGCISLLDTASIGKDWLCPECTKIKKVENSLSAGNNISETNSSHSSDGIASSAHTKHSQISVGVEIIEDLRRELSACVTEMRELRKEMAEVRTSVASLNGRLDGFEQRLEALEQREPCTKKVNELEETVTQLQLELNSKDQEALLSDLEIVQLPEEKGENVVHTVCVLAARLGVPIQDKDIVFAERIGPLVEREGEIVGAASRGRRVVVRLARRFLRDQLLSAARVRRTISVKDAGQPSPSQRIYINERLTRTNRQLFFRVREECRKQNWRFSWTKRGRIFARQGEGKQVYSFRTESDIYRILGKSAT